MTTLSPARDSGVPRRSPAQPEAQWRGWLNGLLRRPYLVLAALVLLTALPYAVLGAGFVLDDWFALGHAHFDGAFMAAGHEQWLARPGQGLVYFLTFGLVGEHPFVHYAIQIALSAVAAVLIYRILERLASPGIALGVAALWVVLPNHASLTRWPSATGILVALVLLLWGCLLYTSAAPTVRSEVGGGLLLATSMLCYEATAPAAAVAALLLPYAVHRRWRWRGAFLAWAGLGAATAWMLVNFHPAKAAVHETADLSQLLPAHFGWGVAPQVTTPLLTVLALAGFAAVLIQGLALGDRRREVHWLVLAGLALIVLGTAPFLRYYYAPLGAGDRANVVAGVGTALCWAGLARLSWRWNPRLTIAAGVLVVGSMAAAGVEGDRAWHQAGRLAADVLAALPATAPEGTIVVGPESVQYRNVAAFLDRSNIEPAVQLRLDDESAEARLSFTEEEFESAPPELRIDVRQFARLDAP